MFITGGDDDIDKVRGVLKYNSSIDSKIMSVPDTNFSSVVAPGMYIESLKGANMFSEKDFKNFNNPLYYSYYDDLNEVDDPWVKINGNQGQSNWSLHFSSKHIETVNENSWTCYYTPGGIEFTSCTTLNGSTGSWRYDNKGDDSALYCRDTSVVASSTQGVCGITNTDWSCKIDSTLSSENCCDPMICTLVGEDYANARCKIPTPAPTPAPAPSCSDYDSDSPPADCTIVQRDSFCSQSEERNDGYKFCLYNIPVGSKDNTGDEPLLFCSSVQAGGICPARESYGGTCSC